MVVLWLEWGRLGRQVLGLSRQEHQEEPALQVYKWTDSSEVTPMDADPSDAWPQHCAPGAGA